MPGPGIDPSQDQDFLKASPQDQHAYLMSVDRDYAKASPEDQKAYLGSLSQSGGKAGGATQAGAEQAQKQAPGLWDYAKLGVGAASQLTGGKWAMGALKDWAGKKVEANAQEDLSRAAHGESPAYSGWSLGGIEQGALRMLGSTAKMGEAAAKPENAAIAGAAMAAPEIAMPAMVAHGAYNLVKNPKPALGGNPDAMENEFSSAAEMTGGLAGTREVIASPETTGTAKIMQGARRVLGREIAPESADIVRSEGAHQAPLANTPREVLQHAQQEGINLTPFQATEKGLAGEVQAAGEHGLAGGQGLRNAMNTERAKFGEAVNRFAERTDPQRAGLSEEQAGETIRDAAQKSKDVRHGNATDRYQNLPVTQVDAGPIAEAWKSHSEAMPPGAEEKILSQIPREMQKTVRQILSGEKVDPIDSEQAIRLRSTFLDLNRTIGAELPSRAQAVFGKMAAATDDALAEGMAGADAVRTWREANAGWKDYVGKYGDRQSPLFKILNQSDPATITRQILNRGSANDILLLKEEGMKGAIDALRRQTVNDIARGKFRVGRDGLGGYSDAFLEQLFGPAKKELYLKADLARRMNWDPNPSGTAGQTQVSEQFFDPKKAMRLMGAAKLSMPRPVGSYLEGLRGERNFALPGIDELQEQRTLRPTQLNFDTISGPLFETQAEPPAMTRKMTLYEGERPTVNGVNVLRSSGRKIITPRSADTSGPVDLGTPRAAEGTRAKRLGLLLPEKTGQALDATEKGPVGGTGPNQKPSAFQMARSSVEHPDNAKVIQYTGKTEPGGKAGMPLQKAAPDLDRDARQEVENLHALWSELPAPGRFTHLANEAIGINGVSKPDIVSYGINSPRPAVMDMFPWLRDLPMMTLSRVKQALEKGKGVDFDRIVRAAKEHLAKERTSEPERPRMREPGED